MGLSFDQLSDEAKAKVIEDYREHSIDWDWQQDTLDYFVGEKYPHIKDMNVSFSGFWSQGDGASFTGWLPYEWVKENILSEAQKILIRDIDCDFVRSRASRYVHQHSVSSDLEITYALHIEENEILCEEIGTGLYNEIEGAIEEYRLEVCNDIYSQLQKEYEYRQSEENVSEWAECNEMLFEENGEIV